MLLADEPNIREVILFPMNQKAEDLMMNAPSEVMASSSRSCTSRSSTRARRGPKRDETHSCAASNRLSASGGASFAPWGTRKSVENGSALAALRDHLAELQLPQIAHRPPRDHPVRRPRGIGQEEDAEAARGRFRPCHFAVHAIGFDRREASEGHWLARFWRSLPSAGNTAIFYRSWYRRVLDDRVAAASTKTRSARSFDEINEFEAQQRDYGTLIVKLYFKVSANSATAACATGGQSMVAGIRRDEPMRANDPAYLHAFEALKANSDTRWSPWVMIDGNDEEQAAIAALSAIADAWAEAMPAEPPHLVAAAVRA